MLVFTKYLLSARVLYVSVWPNEEEPQYFMQLLLSSDIIWLTDRNEIGGQKEVTEVNKIASAYWLEDI